MYVNVMLTSCADSIYKACVRSMGIFPLIIDVFFHFFHPNRMGIPSQEKKTSNHTGKT